MSAYILCRTRAAKNPYYIENTGTNIFTLEELCYYAANYAPLLDPSILNEDLVRWVAGELKLQGLAMNMGKALRAKKRVADFILPIFLEAGYMTNAEMNDYARMLDEMKKLPVPERLKLKGDSLVKSGKYASAIRSYRSLLDAPGPMEDSLRAGIWHNLGVAQMKLLLFAEGLRSFREAYDLDPTPARRQVCICAARITRPEKKFREEMAEAGMDAEAVKTAEEAVDVARKAALSLELPEDPEEFLIEEMAAYHSAVGA